MSSKVVEAGAGIHSLAIAVAVRSIHHIRPYHLFEFEVIPACHKLAIVR